MERGKILMTCSKKQKFVFGSAAAEEEGQEYLVNVRVIS